MTHDLNDEHAPDPVWRTKDGREIPVSRMTTEHVLNAGRYCRRAAASCMHTAFMAGSYASTAPDGAAMAAEAEAEGLMEQAGRLLAWAGYFDKVALERGAAPRPERISTAPYGGEDGDDD